MSAGEISADAVTSDLRTKENTLSFWRCRTETNGDVEDAVLAIAAAGDRLDRLDVVWLSYDELQADGQTFRNTDGRTPVRELADRHVDVCKLDYTRLGKVARRVVAAIEDKRCRRFTKAGVKKLLSAAVGHGRINLDDLSNGLRAEMAG